MAGRSQPRYPIQRRDLVIRDVIFHLADGHMEKGLRAFFGRSDWHHALGCARFEIDPQSETDLYRVPGHTDGGIWKHAHENLQVFKDRYHHAVVLLDADFDPHPGVEVLVKDISNGMIKSGWEENRFSVIVIEPELESWLWAPNKNIAQAFGHSDFNELRKLLETEQLWNPGEPKPHDLKGARDLAAKLGGKKTGGPIFKNAFEAISRRALDRCIEPGFIKLRAAMSEWFPAREAVLAESREAVEVQ